jgi:DNA modification methylase
MNTNTIIQGDARKILKTLPDESIDCIITSPPYWGLRDYGMKNQIGLEPTISEYINNLFEVFEECKRILRKTGTMWVNIGDTFAGSGKGIGSDHGKSSISDEEISTTDWSKTGIPDKCLCQIPSRFAIAMTDREWILRNTIIWQKPNQMPESVTDRFTEDYEFVYFFVKNQQYYFERQFEPANYQENVYRQELRQNKTYNSKEPYQRNFPDSFDPGKRNKRCVWYIPTKPYPDAHFAVFPKALCITPIVAGCPEGGIVLDPFMGSGTTAVVAREHSRKYIGIELNPEYIKLAEKRLAQQVIWEV